MTVIQINVPYPMLLHRTDFAVKNRIHPEIYFSGDDLDQYRDGDIQRLSETLHQHQLEITFHAPFMDLSPGGVDPETERSHPGPILESHRVGPFLQTEVDRFPSWL